MAGDGVLFAERANECMAAASLTRSGGGGAGEPSLKGRLAAVIRPETKRAIHGQGESAVTGGGGPNPLSVQSHGMSCG